MQSLFSNFPLMEVPRTALVFMRKYLIELGYFIPESVFDAKPEWYYKASFKCMALQRRSRMALKRLNNKKSKSSY